MTELKRRVNMLRNVMVNQEVDLAAVGPTATMRYLAGYTSHPDERLCLLLISSRTTPWQGEPICAVVPSINAGEWEANTDILLYPWSDEEGPQQAINLALSGVLPVKKLAFDGEARADFQLTLMAVATPRETVTINSLDASLRLCKSSQEVEALALAAAQADRAMQVAIDTCLPGVSESDVAWAAEAAFRQDGAEEVCFTLVASGPNGAYPHHQSSDRRLQNGDAIIIDIGASLTHYKSDITRMVFLGEPTQGFLQAYDAVLEANERARATIQPGVAAQEIDRAARRCLKDAGLAGYFIHRTGHGLGLDIHEPPWIMEGNEQILEAGMVFSVEPGVYMPGKFGIRIEDIVVVTNTGVRTLTGSDHQLIIKP